MVIKRLKYIGPEIFGISPGDILDCVIHTSSGRVYVQCSRGVMIYTSLKDLLENWSEL